MLVAIDTTKHNERKCDPFQRLWVKVHTYKTSFHVSLKGVYHVVGDLTLTPKFKSLGSASGLLHAQ